MKKWTLFLLNTMPVEIKELIIRATTTETQENVSSGVKYPQVSDDKEAIIAECVKQVLKILKKSKER
ncbi:MAG: DUF5908 family protein [Candidatus Competibacteraceae bacterium]